MVLFNQYKDFHIEYMEPIQILHTGIQEAREVKEAPPAPTSNPNKIESEANYGKVGLFSEDFPNFREDGKAACRWKCSLYLTKHTALLSKNNISGSETIAG